MMTLPAETVELDCRIEAYIRRGADPADRSAADREEFNRLALEAFALQFESIHLYRRYCRRRDIEPSGIARWQEIPAIPTEVFKAVSLSVHPQAVQATFKTSGTSSETERGSVGYDAGGLGLMDATIRTAGDSFLFPDGVKPVFLVMAPPPQAAPEMVMAYGMGHLIQYFGRPESRFLIGKGGFDPQALVTILEKLSAEGKAVALCGGSFGFVNFFDYCDSHGISFHLPSGSRCLDAGGFKGRSREVTRDAFVERCAEKLGMEDAFSVNLLGMTEIASQFYDNSLRCRVQGLDKPRCKVNPPWTRTLVVDADTLEPLPPGEKGLLRHLDLANRGHVLAIQTDDVGVMTPDGFEIIGRAGEGEARGCSLTIDELTASMEES